MSKKISLYVMIAGILLLSACSASEKKEKETNGEKEEHTVDKSTNITSYIGEQIDVAEDGSIQLPFHDQVLAADFSKDDHIKLLAFDEYIMIVEGQEIIHVEEAAPEHHLHSDELTVSEDGRFVTWRGHQDDFEISVFDVKNKESHLVEKTEDTDPYDVFAPHHIEKVEDSYYLMMNDYWAALNLQHLDDGSVKVLDLNNLEIKNDRKTIEKVSPKKPIEDDDMYHELKAEGSEMGLEDGIYSEDGYYKLFYAFEEVGENDETMSLTNLYGADVEKSVMKEIKIEGLEFGKDNIHVMYFSELDTEQMQVGDNGIVILPIIDGNVEENEYTLSVYVIDLTEENPLATLVTEEEVSDVRPSMFFNEDESAMYLSTEDGMKRYVVKE